MPSQTHQTQQSQFYDAIRYYFAPVLLLCFLVNLPFYPNVGYL